MVGRGCRTRHRAEMEPRAGSVAPDRFLRLQRARWAERQPLRPAEIVCGEVSFNPPSPAFPSITSSGSRLWPLFVRTSWQAHRKHRPLAGLARHGHVTAHHARELAREGKAKSRAPETLCSRGIGLAELLEQLGLLLRRHANAGISDRELDPVATVGDPARPQPDFAFPGELARIAEEIEQDLPQPHRVHGQCAEVLLSIDDEAVLVLLGKLSGG